VASSTKTLCLSSAFGEKIGEVCAILTEAGIEDCSNIIAQSWSGADGVLLVSSELKPDSTIYAVIKIVSSNARAMTMLSLVELMPSIKFGLRRI